MEQVNRKSTGPAPHQVGQPLHSSQVESLELFQYSSKAENSRSNEAQIPVSPLSSGCGDACRLEWASRGMGSSIPMQHLQSCTSELGSQDALLGASGGSLSCSCDGKSSGHVTINVSDISSRRKLVTNEIEAIGLWEIHQDQRLMLILADWEKKLKESQDRKERKQALSLNVKNEIYHLIGFFSVFQGVVLTTVSQASQLTCHNWWGPFALSLLASLTTLVGVCHKFYNFIGWKRATDIEVYNSTVLKSQISRLKKFGRGFDFSVHAPDVGPRTEEPFQFARYYVLAVLVIVSMLGFSAIMLISCQRILCDKRVRDLFEQGIIMVRVSTILENGTSSQFEVRSESSCGVHTVLKTLSPRETFKLERSSSDTYLQHWVVMGSAVVLSFSSDELVDNDKITIVSDGSIYRKVVNARPLRSASLPSRRSSHVQPEGVEGQSHRSSTSKPPVWSFRKFFSSLIGRSSDASAEEGFEPSFQPDVHQPYRVHSLP